MAKSKGGGYKTITAYGLNGMNNVEKGYSKLLDDFRRMTPSSLYDADAFASGTLLPRGGYDKIIALNDCHSLWRGTVTLCVARGASNKMAVYRVYEATAAELTEIDNAGNLPMSFVEVDGMVYMSNGAWTQKYDVSLNSVSAWGLNLPPAPNIQPCEGNLPAGVYSICFALIDDYGNYGGAGPVLTFAWDGGVSGVKVLNKPTGAAVFLTNPNGKTLFLASLDGSDQITAEPSIVPLMTLGVSAPPGMTSLAYAHGRIWGCYNNEVRYSDPMFYEWFRDNNRIFFTEKVEMIAPTLNGMYVSSRTSTWFLEGADPAKMKMQKVGDGAIPGTLTEALVEGGGYEISRTLSQMPSPVWLGARGVVVGSQHGHLVLLSETKVKLSGTGTRGAGLQRYVDGQTQIIMSTV